MPELKNTFLEGKMNKDLDARLLKNGEYVHAQNIHVTKSEGSDVGTVQNIKGNQLNYNTAHTGVNDYGRVIGHFVDNERDNNNEYRIFLFVKGNSQYNDNIYLSKQNASGATTEPTPLINNSSNFLKFNINYLITGINLIDNLLFWTDNLNQPRRINVLTAIGNTSYYNNEDKISVAKYYPYLPPQVLRTIGSTNYTGMQKGNTSITVSTSITNTKDIVLASADYNNDIHTGMQMHEGTTPIGVVETISSDGLTITSDTTLNITNVPATITFTNSNDRIEEKFVRFAYRFKFADGEYSLISPFTQHCFIPKTYNNSTGLTSTQEADAAKSTELESFTNDVTHVNLQIELPSSSPTTDFEIDKLEILMKESDRPAIKSIEQVNITDSSVGVDKIYQYIYKSSLPYKTLPEKQLTRVYDNVPAKAKAQEIIGNRIVYGNYQENPNNKPYDPDSDYSFDYTIGLEQKISTLPNEKYHIQYPYHTIKTRRTYQVGIVLADRYGRQSPVFLSDNIDNSIIRVNAKSSAEVGSTWNGEALRITFNTAIPDSDINRASVLYDPVNPTANPTGWYSYKIVVKQNEQDYYNIYAGGARDNLPNAQTLASEYNTFYTDADKRTWLVLSGDNINKVPRDTTQQAEDDTSVFPSNVSLYPKVINYASAGPPAVNIMSEGPIVDVISVGKALDHGLEYYDGTQAAPVDQRTGHTYQIFDNYRKNPLLAELPNGYGEDVTVNQNNAFPTVFNYSGTNFSVWETKPFESALDIYYETLTCGLISDLKTEIETGSGGGSVPTGTIPTSIRFIDTTTTASFEEGLTAPSTLKNLETLDQNGTAITGGGLTYSIVSVLEDNAQPPIQQAAETHFGIADLGNNLFGLRITNNEFYWGASGHTYTVRVKVLSSGNPAIYQDFTITLNNTNPTLVLPATADLVHFQSTATVFSPLSTTVNGSADTDQDNIFTKTNAYQITGVTYDPGGNDEDSSSTQTAKFSVNGSTGVVSVNNHIFPASEVGKVYRITMTVTDDGNATSQPDSCDVTIGGWFWGNYLYGAITDICGVRNANSPSQNFYIKRPTSNTSTSLTPQYNDEVYTDAALTTAFNSGAVITSIIGGGGDQTGVHFEVSGGKIQTLNQPNNCSGYPGP